MKKSIFLSVILFVLAVTINAQNDTMYIMKNAAIVGKYNVITEVDSIIFYRPIIQNTTILIETFDTICNNQTFNFRGRDLNLTGIYFDSLLQHWVTTASTNSICK